jgi:predicted GNAT family acetyltransferase
MALKSKLVRVKINGKNYTAPFKTEMKVKPGEWVLKGDKTLPSEILMISSHPKNPKRVIVWRKNRWGPISIYLAVEASLRNGRITEAPSFSTYAKKPVAAVQEMDETGGTSMIQHFIISPSLRKIGIGTVMREILISKEKRSGARVIDYPASTGHIPGFYVDRGFKKKGSGFVATIDQLDYSKNKNLKKWSDTLEKNNFRIYWAKNRKMKD